ncbi:MAG: flavin reductase [Proteobacteria bacterium]|nr:flavin reductase [Pseudomonadota bacterium]
MKAFPFYENFDVLCRALNSNGAFLAVKDRDGRSNIMTIGWATVGIVWSKHVMTVMVRPVRYTHELIENATAFSVCVPSGKYGHELMTCGTESGRNIDKAKKTGLSLVPGKLKDSIIVMECDLFYECEIIHKNAVEPGSLKPDIKGDLYPKNDFHTIYYGEIKHAYTK